MLVVVKLERDANLGKPFIPESTTSTLSSNMRTFCGKGDIGTSTASSNMRAFCGDDDLSCQSALRTPI